MFFDRQYHWATFLERPISIADKQYFQCDSINILSDRSSTLILICLHVYIFYIIFLIFALLYYLEHSQSVIKNKCDILVIITVEICFASNNKNILQPKLMYSQVFFLNGGQTSRS